MKSMVKRYFYSGVRKKKDALFGAFTLRQIKNCHINRRLSKSSRVCYDRKPWRWQKKSYTDKVASRIKAQAKVGMGQRIVWSSPWPKLLEC